MGYNKSSGTGASSSDKARPVMNVAAREGEKGLAKTGKVRNVEACDQSRNRVSTSVGEASEKLKVSPIPEFRGIDERAEDFINKFRQDMKLQREQSILEFQEMLKRSS